jgi:hypothetical protein
VLRGKPGVLVWCHERVLRMELNDLWRGR